MNLYGLTVAMDFSIKSAVSLYPSDLATNYDTLLVISSL